MIVSTTFDVLGYKITEYLGIVRGVIVRSPTISQGIVGGLKNIVGGKIGAYTDMCEQACQQAYHQMVEHALELGADAVLGMRYDASDVVDRSTEVLCYGTAVRLEQVT